MSFQEWMVSQGHSVQDFAERKAELKAEYAESLKVRGKNTKRRCKVDVYGPDRSFLGTVSNAETGEEIEMDYRESDVALAAELWLAVHAPNLGISIDSEGLPRCTAVARIVTVSTSEPVRLFQD